MLPEGSSRSHSEVHPPINAPIIGAESLFPAFFSSTDLFYRLGYLNVSLVASVRITAENSSDVMCSRSPSNSMRSPTENCATTVGSKACADYQNVDELGISSHRCVFRSCFEG